MAVELDDRGLGLGDDEVEAVSRLLLSVFGESMHMDSTYVDWCYRRNPLGPAVGRNAWEGGRLAAHYVTIPVRARLFGGEARGVLSLHTATHPDYQGRGLFTRLAEATYREAREAGYEFVVGVANASSTPGFLRKLDFQLVAPLDVRIGLGAPAPARSDPDAAFERVWNESELAWRLACPAREYRRTAGAGGVTVYAPTGRYGIWVEVASRPADECQTGSPLAKLEPLGLRNPVRLWMGLDRTREWTAQPWIRLPDAAKPSPLNLIYRDLKEPGRTLDPARVRFAAIDFDAY